MKGISVRLLSFGFSIVLLMLILGLWLTASAEKQEPPQSQPTQTQPIQEEPSQPQEEMLPEEAQQQQWTKTFQEAEALFNSADQATSIPVFQDLITQITEQKIKRGLSDPEQLILWKSLDYLGEAFYNDGQLDQSQIVFLKLIELNPNYKLNEDLVSTKIVDFVQKLKIRNLGTLSITSDPPGATIKLDGAPAGTTDLSLYSLKGDHDIEVTKPGFVSQRQAVSVIPQKTEKIHFKLERVSSVAYFITYPKGVELFQSGKRLGVTGGDATERSATAAAQMNLPSQEFSGEFSLTDLQVGEYEIEFRKPCWETQHRKITIDRNDDYYFEPVVLSPSYSYLNITSNDEKANIFVDDEYIGIVPKPNLKICSGKHVVKLKGPSGKYEKQIEIRKDESIAIQARLNPSLTFLGLLSEPDILKSDLQQIEAEIIRNLSNLQHLNFVDYSDRPDKTATDEKLRAIVDGINTNKPDKDRRAALQELCTKVESDLLLVGFVPKEKLQRSVKLYLLSNWSSMADIRAIQAFSPADWSTLTAQLEYEEPLFQKRIGVQWIDTGVTPGPVISQVLMKTDEGSQVLLPADILLTIQGKSLKNSAEVRNVMKGAQSLDRINLTVERAGVPTNLSVQLLNSPMEIELSNPSLLFNRQLTGFKKAFNLSTNPLERNIALLNIGLCHMHFGEFDVAFEQLRQVQLNRMTGIGPGTLQYRIAQCYGELGYRQEAAEALNEAARFPQNTLFSDDGPAVGKEAKRALAANR
jgi:tetratricopeptide (TPR) repeat protein